MAAPGQALSLTSWLTRLKSFLIFAASDANIFLQTEDRTEKGES